MGNRTIVELNHDHCPRLDARELLAWALRVRLYMGAAEPEWLPDGVRFLHYRHHSEDLPFKPQERARHRMPNAHAVSVKVESLLAEAKAKP